MTKIETVLLDHGITGDVQDTELIVREEEYSIYAVYMVDGRKYDVRLDVDGDTWVEQQ